MYWFYLLIAGIFEIAWAIGMKLSDGFSNVTISILTVVGMILSFYFLSLALKNIPLGTAYAVWTGIGTIGTVILGMMHKFSSTTDDGLRLHIRRYNGGCSCVGEPGERLAVNFGPKDDFIRRSMYFAGKDRFKNAKTYIEQVRISNNSLRSKYIRKHSLMQSSLRVT